MPCVLADAERLYGAHGVAFFTLECAVVDGKKQMRPAEGLAARAAGRCRAQASREERRVRPHRVHRVRSDLARRRRRGLMKEWAPFHFLLMLEALRGR